MYYTATDRLADELVAMTDGDTIEGFQTPAGHHAWLGYDLTSEGHLFTVHTVTGPQCHHTQLSDVPDFTGKYIAAGRLAAFITTNL